MLYTDTLGENGELGAEATKMADDASPVVNAEEFDDNEEDEMETPIDDVRPKRPHKVSPLSPKSRAKIDEAKVSMHPTSATKTIRVASAGPRPEQEDEPRMLHESLSEPNLQTQANGTHHFEEEAKEFEDIDLNANKIPVANKAMKLKRNRSRVGRAVRMAGTGARYAGRAALKTAAATGRVAVKVGGHAVRGAGFVSRKAVTGCLSPQMLLARTFFIFVCCFVTTGVQLGLFDFYYITYTCNANYYAWISGDLLVLCLLTMLLIIQCRYTIKCARKREFEIDMKTEYAWLVWGVYSSLVCAKMVTGNYTFAQVLPLTPNPALSNSTCSVGTNTQLTFGLNAYRLIIATSTIVYLLLVLSHHYSRLRTPRQVYLSFLASAITLDILDSVQFMDFLYPAIHSPLTLPMQIVVQVFACTNFILPTFALLKLRFAELPHLSFLPYEKMYTMAYFLLSNVPYLVIRIILYTTGSADNNVQIFLVKNVIGVIISVREIWLAYLFYKERVEGAEVEGDAILQHVSEPEFGFA